MLKRLNDFLASLPMTLVGAVFLVASFVLPRLGVDLPIDPAWVTVVISGIPLLYLAVWRIIHNPGVSKISSALLIVIAMFAAIGIGDLFAAGEVAFIMALGPCWRTPPPTGPRRASRNSSAWPLPRAAGSGTGRRSWSRQIRSVKVMYSASCPVRPSRWTAPFLAARPRWTSPS